jgi:hypothetical protein
MKHYHLAQINTGRVLGPIGSEIMKEFVDNLDRVNAIADQSPGFVWRLQTEDGNATSVQVFDDPMQLLNLSVWESVETLKEFVYKTVHASFVKRRYEWFEKFPKPYIAMWWIPAGHIPTPIEARERLEFLQRHGETPVAFSFRKMFATPDAPEAVATESPVSYHGRKFAVRANAASADCTPETSFHYRQSGSRVWATYQGGSVRFGSLVAVTDASGGLDMRYHHVDRSDTLRTGVCYSRPEFLEGGRLRIHETWHRTSDVLNGQSILEEIA